MNGPHGNQHSPAVACEAIVPIRLAERWETAYRRYGRASTLAARATPGDRQTAHAVATTSAQVAAAWRDMAKTDGIAWWALAALRAAAEAFEAQARNWQARAELSGGTTAMGSRPTVIRRPADHG